jgi:SAM-dependent methyltransferase
MNETFTYHEYVTDEKFLAQYNAYQTKYAKQMRESDKVLIGLIRDVVEKRGNIGRPLRLLDVGCSTGNLLLHLKRLIPSLSLAGGDLAESSLEECRANPELDGIEFISLDMLKINTGVQYDIIVANAVAVYFLWDEYRQAAESVFNALAHGGSYLAFEWLHPFVHQDIVINETSISHPNGIRICFRPTKKVSDVFVAAGFRAVDFFPFQLPIELPPADASGEVVSYTRKSIDGENLCFRGALSQPWCHMMAFKV